MAIEGCPDFPLFKTLPAGTQIPAKINQTELVVTYSTPPICPTKCRIPGVTNVDQRLRGAPSDTAQTIEVRDRKSKAARRGAAMAPSCADHLIVLQPSPVL